MKRGQEENVVEEPAKKQPKLEEENQEEDDQPAEEFLKPELACEIYAALPAFHQRRLLILCNDIWELGPSTDEWIKWKILKWAGNKWDANDCCDEEMHFSFDGFNITRKYDPNFLVRALHGAEFLPTQLEGPQFCYFETKHIKGSFCFGFDVPIQMDANDGNNTRSSFVLFHDSDLLLAGNWNQLPNFSIGDNEIAVVGCGLMKHLGKRKVFFTKNGQLIAKPIPLPSTARDVLFPVISTDSSDFRFVDTNFGLRPFQFKYKGNEEKLLEEMTF